MDVNIIDVISKMLEGEDRITKIRQSSQDDFKFNFWYKDLMFSIYKVGEYCELSYYPRPSRDIDLMMKPFHSSEPPSEIRFESIDFVSEDDQAAFYELYYIVSQKASI